MKQLTVLIIFITLLSCSKENLKPSAGDADFSRVVAIGASVTAGASDYGMFRDGQLNSYPAIIAKQLKNVGMKGEFKQPLFPDNIGIAQDYHLGGEFCSRFVLKYMKDCKGNEYLDGDPIIGYYSMTTDIAKILEYMSPMGSKGPFNNVAVPGSKSFELLEKDFGSSSAITDVVDGGNSGASPLFYRFCSNPGNTSVLDDAKLINASFVIFGLDLGGNDVLIFATGSDHNGSQYITPFAKFKESYEEIIKELTKNGAKGVVGTVPDVCSIGYFKKYKYNDLIITDQTRLNALRNKYPNMTFNLGRNAFVIKDSRDVIRQIEPNELVDMGFDFNRVICDGYGAEEPLTDSHSLDKYQIEQIRNATEQYNMFIKEMADKYNLAFCDINKSFTVWSKGTYIDGRRLSSDYITGGLFSLDGIHATFLGNAVIANMYIDAINEKYQSTIPKVNISDYKGLQFPNRQE